MSAMHETADANDAMETEESAGATSPVGSPSAAPPPTATWSFVQMNMSLLPIARPLPVTTVCHRFQESFQTGKKPRTPNQKLHRRVLQNASNISPRRHDLGGTVRRVSNAGLFGVSASPPPQQSHDQLRIATPPTSASSSLSPSTLTPMDASAAVCVRSQSEVLAVRPVKNKRMCDDTSGSSGYASDSCDSAVVPPRGALLLSRSVSLSATCTAADSKAYKGKRIMELLDEERRLHPDERSTAQSPTKRSRYQ